MTRSAPDDRAVQRHAIGVSVEALASAWARRDAVPGGSVVVVDSEIAARRRLGEPWSAATGDALALAMVLRPDIAPSLEGLLWLVGTLAAAESGAACSDLHMAICWPDTLEVVESNDAVAFTNVVTQLGPGCIEHSVISIRFLLSGLGLTESDRTDLFHHAVLELDGAVSLLVEDPQGLIDAVTERASTIGNRVKVALLPRGEARGKATAVDPEGRLVLETPTGMLDYVSVDSLRAIETV